MRIVPLIRATAASPAVAVALGGLMSSPAAANESGNHFRETHATSSRSSDTWTIASNGIDLVVATDARTGIAPQVVTLREGY